MYGSTCKRRVRLRSSAAYLAAAALIITTSAAGAGPSGFISTSINSSLTDAIQGQSAQIQAAATLRQTLGKGTSYSADCLWNGTVVQHVGPQSLALGQSLSCSYGTGRLQPPSGSTTNTFTINAYLTQPSGTRQLYGTSSQTITVHPDTVAPVFSCTSPVLPFQNPYMQNLPRLQCQLADSYGYLDATSFVHVSVDGVDQTSKLAITTAQSSGQWISSYNIAGDLNPLTEGQHTVAISGGKDLAGNVASPLSFSFTIDRTPPAVTLAQSVPTITNQKDAQFTFSANEPATFSCSVDGSASSSCTSPVNVTGLADGSHTFSVSATDRAGNTSATTSFSWTVDTTPPVITLTQDVQAVTNQLTANFTFSANEQASFSCVLDAQASQPCSSPLSYSNLAPGIHVFSVTGLDLAGNLSAPVSFAWAIVVAPPKFLSLSPPTNSYINSRSVVISGTSDEKLTGAAANGTPLAIGSDGTSFSGQLQFAADGPQQILVMITNAAGKATGKSLSLMIDSTAPVIAHDAPDGSTTGQQLFSFHVSVNDISPTITTVSQNGTKIFTSPEQALTIPFSTVPLGQDGTIGAAPDRSPFNIDFGQAVTQILSAPGRAGASINPDGTVSYVPNPQTIFNVALVSKTPTGSFDSGRNVQPSYFGNGQKVAFFSNATDIVPGITTAPGLISTYIYDVKSQAISRLLTASGAEPDGVVGPGNGTADGTKLLFYTNADNFEAGPNPNGPVQEVYVHNFASNSNQLVYHAGDGSRLNADVGVAVLSSDGSKALFTTPATNVLPSVNNGADNVYLVDLTSNSVTNVSVALDGTAANGATDDVAISGNGSVIVMDSFATNMTADQLSGQYPSVFVRNGAGAISLASVNNKGEPANNPSFFTGISDDGRFVTFISYADNLGAQPGTGAHLYIRDILANQTNEVKFTSDGSPLLAQDGSFFPNINFYALTPDARYFILSTDAANVGSYGSNGFLQCYLLDRMSGKVSLVSSSASGQAADRHCVLAAVAPDGQSAIVNTRADNLTTPGNTTGLLNLYLVTKNDPFQVQLADGSTKSATVTEPVAGSSTNQVFRIDSVLAAGSNQFQIQSTDAAGNTSQTVNVQSITYDPIPLIVTSTSIHNGDTITQLPVTLTVTTNKPVVWAMIGPNPATIAPDGLSFSGQPELPQSGAAVITFQARDGSGNLVQQAIPVNINTGPFTLAINSPQPGTPVGSTTVAVSGGTSWALSGVSATVGSNSQPLQLNPDRTSFQGSVQIAAVAGAQALTIQATSTTGQSITQTIPVSYVPPGVSTSSAPLVINGPSAQPLAPPTPTYTGALGQVVSSLLQANALLWIAAGSTGQDQTDALNQIYYLTGQGTTAFNQVDPSQVNPALLTQLQNTLAVLNTLVQTASLGTPPTSDTLRQLALQSSSNTVSSQPMLVTGNHNPPITSLPWSFNLALSLSPAFFGSMVFTGGSATCTPVPVTVPSDPNSLLSTSDLFSQVSPSVQKLAQTLGTPEAALAYVRSQIDLITRPGATQTASQTLRSGAGSAIDKATTLISLYRSMGVPAEYLFGEKLVTNEFARQYYGVGSDTDLAWAHATMFSRYFAPATSGGVFDPYLMLSTQNGGSYWVMPSVWVHAYVNGAWVMLDPAYAPHDYVAGGLLEAPIDSNSFTSKYLFPSFFPNLFTQLTTPIDQSDLIETLSRTTTVKQSLDSVGMIDEGLSVNFDSSGNIATADETNRGGSTAPWLIPCVEAQGASVPPQFAIMSSINVSDSSGNQLLNAQVPLAQIRDAGVAITNSAGLSGAGASGLGTLSLMKGELTLSSAPNVAIGTILAIDHGIADAPRYASNYEERAFAGPRSGGVQFIIHAAAPVVEQDLTEATKMAEDLIVSDSPDQAALETALLRMASVYALVRATNHDSDESDIRGVTHVTQSLMVAFNDSGVWQPGANLGAVPRGSLIDWQLGGPLYSQTGAFADYSNYVNIGHAKGELIVAASSTTAEIWQELFGTPAESAVSALRLAQQAGPPGAPVLTASLSGGAEQSIFGAFQPEMAAYEPYLQAFEGEQPILYTTTGYVTSNTGNTSQTGGGTASQSLLAFVIFPSNPLGHAGAFMANVLTPADSTAPVASRLLAGAVDDLSPEEEDEYTQLVDDILAMDEATTPAQIGDADLGPYLADPNFELYDFGIFNAITCAWIEAQEAAAPGANLSADVTPGSVTQAGAALLCQLRNLADTSDAPDDLNPDDSPQNNPQECACGGDCSGQPVTNATGVMWHQLTDFVVKGRTPATTIAFTRTYFSKPYAKAGDFGSNWTHNWETKLLGHAATDVIWLDQNGAAWLFKRNADGTLTPPAGTGLSLTVNGANYVLRMKGGVSLTYAAPDSGPRDPVHPKFTLTELTSFCQGTLDPTACLADLENLCNHFQGLCNLVDGVVLPTDSSGASAGTATYTAPPGALLSLTEPHGDTITANYLNGALSTLHNDFIGTISFTRNAQGQITQILRQRDNLAYNYSYDANGMLSSSADFAGHTYTYGYNQGQVGTKAAGLLTSITDPLGRKLGFTYYDDGRAFEQTEPGGGYRAYVYGLDSVTSQRWTRMQDLDGNTMTWYFDALGNPTQVVNPDGSRAQKQWVLGVHGPVAAVDELGFTSRYSYDARGNLASIQRPLDPAPVTINYDQSFDKPLQINPLAGSPTSFDLNPNTGDTTQISRADDQGPLSLGLQNDAFGNVVSVDNGISLYSNQTDANGLLVNIFDLHNPQTLTNDNRGRLKKRHFQSGRELTYTYDDFDRITTIADTHGPSASFVYDAMGKLLSKTVSDGTAPQVTRYEWDDRDRLISKTDPQNRVTRINYNIISVGCQVRDKPTSITDPAGRITSMSYDNRQRLTRITDAKGQVTRLEYNARGDETAVTDSNGNRMTYSFDGNRRLVQQTTPVLVSGPSGAPTSATQVTNLSYDPAGRLTSSDKYALGIPNATHAVMQISYDPLDRVVEKRLSKVDSSGNVIVIEDDSTYAYKRQLDETVLSSANNATENLSFTYENAPPFALTNYSVAAGTAGASLGLANLGSYSIARDVNGEIGAISGPNGQLYAAGYDPAGRVTGVQSSFMGRNYSAQLAYDGFGRRNSVTHSTGLSGTAAFDTLNRVTNLTWAGDDGTGVNQGFSEGVGYDLAGNVASISRELGSFAYGYDPINQLISASYTGSALNSPLLNRSFGYDSNGNRISDNVNGAGVFFANAILSDAQHAYQMDSQGMGNVVQKTTFASSRIDLYAFRGDSKIVSHMSVTDTNGNGVFDPGIDQVNVSTQYFYDALGRRAAKVISTGGPSFPQSYVYQGDQGAVLLAAAGDGTTTLRLNGQVGGDHLAVVGADGVKAYVTDHLRSVMNGDATGGVAAYGAFGEPLGAISLPTPSSNPLVDGYVGSQRDSESLSDNFNNRQYDFFSGRPLQADPLGIRGGSTNFFTYVGNNPLGLVDLLGFTTEVIVWDPSLRHASSAFGHVSLVIDGTSYSWESKGWSKVSADAYLYGRTGTSNGTGYVLTLTSDQETALRNLLDKNSSKFPDFNYWDVNSNSYGLIGNNCGENAASALRQVGVDIGNYILPSSYGTNLANSYFSGNGLVSDIVSHTRANSPQPQPGSKVPLQ